MSEVCTFFSVTMSLDRLVPRRAAHETSQMWQRWMAR